MQAQLKLVSLTHGRGRRSTTSDMDSSPLVQPGYEVLQLLRYSLPVNFTHGGRNFTPSIWL
jgi:hypothetical protein